MNNENADKRNVNSHDKCVIRQTVYLKKNTHLCLFN